MSKKITNKKQAGPGAKRERKHNPEWSDNTRSERSRRRNEQLEAAALRDGFESWSAAITAWKNGEYRLVPVGPRTVQDAADQERAFRKIERS